MAFCNNCGQKLPDGVKFCTECGTMVSSHPEPQPKPQPQNNSGDARPCPGCGAIIGSFSTHCPMCGVEIRNITAASAVQELSRRLEKINAKEKPSFSRKYITGEEAEAEDAAIKEALDRFDQQIATEKAELIINMPVPNSKEEIMEFMLLASSNIDTKKDTSDKVTKAWITKMDQVYEKAKISMKNTPDFAQVQRIYESKTKAISDSKRRKLYLALAGVLAFILFYVFIFSMAASSGEGGKSQKDEALKLKNVTLELPGYWEEENSQNECLRYEAESDNAAVLEIEFHVDEDPDYDVSFAGLKADNTNMISGIEKQYNDANVLSDEEFESKSGVKGILYTFSLNQSTGLFSEEAAKGYCFCFASEEDRRWFYITMIVTNDAKKHDYVDDYMDLLKSIECS